MLKGCMIKTSNSDEDGEEDGVKVLLHLDSSMCSLQDLIDITLRRMDHDKDGRLSYSDFERSVQVISQGVSPSVQAEPLLMEAFGPCLPNNRASGDFLRSRRTPVLTSVPDSYITPDVFWTAPRREWPITDFWSSAL